jgi:diaminohydroxyphosphoribosylaminopyrimidine deaminase/5-amino-6-(5-phosphoribosylamino)uracil reductase
MHVMSDTQFMRYALRLARRGYGAISPNPMVGAVLVKGGEIIGRGWHRRAGLPHAEIEALHDAKKRGQNPRGATLYVTLEPCCTHGRTPPCTDAIIAAGIRCVAIGATDPNPKHAGKGFKVLARAGIKVVGSSRCDDRTAQRAVPTHIADECAALNEAFNHWIVHRTPFVTIKAAMTLDGKIATASGESKWITGEKARAHGMKLRMGSDAILVGINTILADDPGLTARSQKSEARSQNENARLRRIILDSMARTPLTAKVVSDEFAALTTIVVSELAPKSRVVALTKRANVLIVPLAKSAIGNRQSAISLRWLLKKLGAESVTSLLVEGGGEVNASFLIGGFTQRVAFFYAPKILGGRDSHKGVAGDGAKSLNEIIQLREVEWHKLGEDLLLTARTD